MTVAPPEVPARHVVYLHGFASSPRSSKAQYFARELAAHGVGFSCPDFNEPSFETLTVTRMLAQTRTAIDAAPRGPVALVGSSLGAFVAVHAAVRDPRVDRLILMAPALDFGGNRLRQLGETGIEQWRSDGSISIFHHGYGEPRRVGYALYEDTAQYDALTLAIAQPMLVFQGLHDAAVDPKMIQRWASSRANVDLHLMDDDHQLSATVGDIWRASERFLGLGGLSR